MAFPFYCSNKPMPHTFIIKFDILTGISYLYLATKHYPLYNLRFRKINNPDGSNAKWQRKSWYSFVSTSIESFAYSAKDSIEKFRIKPNKLSAKKQAIFHLNFVV